MPDNSDMLRYTLPRRLNLVAIVAACAVAFIVVAGIVTRVTASREVDKWTEANALPAVSVINLGANEKPGNLSLPGNLQAFNSTPIYARVSGYIKEWKADIGAPVKTGQLLGEIDAPDLDQQIMQAQADVVSAEANATLTKANLERGQSLIQSGAVSKRDLDQREADFASRQGMVKSAQANLDRLKVLEKYKRIVAPFDGLVTSRTTDLGALINAGSGGGPACSWFPTPPSCVSMSTSRRTTFPASRSAPSRKSRCLNIRDDALPRSSRRRHSLSTPDQARRGCSLLSTIPAEN